MLNTKTLLKQQQEELLNILELRFNNNLNRHKNIDWKDVLTKLKTTKNSDKLWSLYQMEITGGEPDIVNYDENTKEHWFMDCSAESPKERRSFCYDKAALDERKENKPKNNALGMAAEIGIDILNEEEYRFLQTLGNFDAKTSSWIKTPNEIRNLGGAIFGDFRFKRVFVYHNGAQSYYAARGFRGILKI